VIATKFSYNAEPGNPNAGGNGRKNILRAVEGSLRRLGTDYIDLYILHTWDRFTPVEEVMRTMDDLVRSGKVLHVGSRMCRPGTRAAPKPWPSCAAGSPSRRCQLEYSLAERTIEHEFVDLGRETGAGIMVWSPLAGGLLSGKYKAEDSGAGAARPDAQLRQPGLCQVHRPQLGRGPRA
jgi:aryl-alcohol dehydrogenase-like predicted oxidoreductase